MTLAVFYKLLAVFITIGLGWVAGRMRWLGDAKAGTDPARILGNAAFYIFVPALLFRTTARLDFSRMPWATVAAFFVPAVVMVLAVYAWQRWRRSPGAEAPLPATRAICASFGNTVQLGIPMAAAVLGEAGLGMHIALVSVHALILLTVLTALVEMDLARERRLNEETAPLGRTLRTTVRNTLIHPVVLPVMSGMVFNATGWPLPGVVDESLQVIGSAVVPLCLVLIGLSLAYSGIRGGLRGALVASALKLLALPALVLVVAHWGFGLTGTPLAVVVMAASLPTGSNALIFAQRYATLEVEATATIVISTFGFAVTASLWLAVLGALGALSP